MYVPLLCVSLTSNVQFCTALLAYTLNIFPERFKNNFFAFKIAQHNGA